MSKASLNAAALDGGIYTYTSPDCVTDIVYQHLTRLTDKLALANTHIILPTKRAARDLTLSFLRENPQASKVLPRIYSPSRLKGFYGDLKVKALTPLERHGLIFKFMSDYLMTMAESQMAKAAPNIHEASKLAELVAELITFNVSQERLDVCFPESFSRHHEVSFGLLKYTYGCYVKWLGESKRLDPAQLLTLSCERFIEQLRKEDTLILAGLDGYIPCIKELILKGAKRGKSIIILPLATNLDLKDIRAARSLEKTHPDYLSQSILKAVLDKKEPSCEIQQVTLTGSKDRGGGLGPLKNENLFTRLFQNDVSPTTCSENVHYFLSDHLEQEAAMTALVAAEHLKNNESVAIICPCPRRRVMIEAELKRWKLEPERAYGNSLWENLSGRAYQCFEQLLLNPGDRKLLLYFTNLPQVKLTDGLRSLGAYPEMVLKGEGLDQMQINALESFQMELKQVALAKEEFFLCLAKCLHRYLKSEVYAPLHLVFTNLHRQGAWATTLRLQDRLSLIRETLVQTELPAPRCHAMISIMDPLHAPFSKAPIKILCALQEGVWPLETPLSPYLNRALRQAVGLPDQQSLIGRGAMLFAFSFGQEKTYLFASKADHKGATSPSRWLRRLTSHYRFSEGHDKRMQVLALQAKRLKYAHRFSVEKPSFPGFIQNIAPPHMRLSIKDLILYEKDPYSFYGRKYLSLYESFEATESFPRAYGTWIHEVLERFLKNKGRTLQELETIASNCLPASLDASLRFELLSTFKAKSDYLFQILEELARGTRETLCEQVVSCSLTYHSTRFEIYGIIDRLDFYKEKGIRLLDYKTGKAPSLRSIKTLENPQLPYLAWLYEQQKGLAENISTLAIAALKEGEYLELETEDLIDQAGEKIKALCHQMSLDHQVFNLNTEYTLKNNGPYRQLSQIDAYLMGGDDKCA